MDSRNETRLGTDPLLPLILRMALPGMTAQAINLLYSIVDRIYIGHIAGYGTQALAGVGITNSIIVLIAAFAQIVGSGGSPRASISLGQGNRERAAKFLGNGVTLLAIFTIVLVFPAALLMNRYLPLIGATEATMPYASAYLSIYLIGTPFVMITLGLNSFIALQGRPGISMCSVIIGAVSNIVLDPVLIFACHMGVRGAAIATVFSQFCSAAWILRFLTSQKASLRIQRAALLPDWAVIRETFSLGVSPFIMCSTESLIYFVLNGCLALYGDIYVSALAVMQSAMQFVTVPLQGFAQGASPVISYNYGSSNTARVKRAFFILLVIMFSFNFAVIGLMMLFPGMVARMFTSDAELIVITARYMPVFMAGFSIFGLQRACQNTFVSTGQALISLFIALLRKVILLIPLVLILHRFLGALGVYLGEAIADGTAALLCTAIFAVKFPKILRGAELRPQDRA